MLEPRIAMTILEYDMSNFRKFLRLSPNWHHLVLEGINERLNRVEVDFVNRYFEHLFFKRSYTNSSIMFFGGKRGIRVDRVLVCEILNQKNEQPKLFGDPPNYHLNKCLKASYKYKFTKGSLLQKNNPGSGQQGGAMAGMMNRNYKNSQRQLEYCADFKMDIVAEN